MLHSTQDTHARAQSAGQADERLNKEAIYAALDLGTNNCRLLVATPQEGGEANALSLPSLKIYDSFSRIVRLGEGVSATGVLSEDAMDRTIAALKVCCKKLQKYRITKARFVATEACRRAANGADFIKRVQDQTGLLIDIISTEEEARLAFLGCSSLLAQGVSRAIVFDIGGGSTELMWVDVDDAKRNPDAISITDWLSVGFGVMNLADKFGGSSLADMAYDDMVKFLVERLKPFDNANRIGEIISKEPQSRVQLLSTSGTVTTLAAVHLNLPRYDRSRIDGIRLKLGDLRNTTQRLLKMRPSERFNHPCIGSDRADFIISGCAIFDAISSVWPAGDITIADRGVREGIILSLISQK